ncbi:MAG: hypothetical protein IJ956_04505 [Akkermansia sp.]|nr:hypothetical protein [Akkermansia sp.]
MFDEKRTHGCLFCLVLRGNGTHRGCGLLIDEGARHHRTKTALCTGLFYGLLLYKKPLPLWKMLLAQGLVSLICYAGLNTLWAWDMGFGRSMEYVKTRLIVNAVAYPVYCGVIFGMNKYRKVLEKAVK